jgi:hypothetical protein
MSRITKEEALDIAKSNIGSLFHIEITDQWNDGWGPIYAADRLADCWYITFSQSLTGHSIGAAYLLAISKEDGSVLHSGPVGE